jgi:hypothetical protein
LFDIVIGGTSAKDFDADIVELEVEENADLPGAFSITLPVATTSTGDYDTVSDPRLAPLSNVAVTAQAADGITQCLVDGYVLAQQIHLDTGTAKSTIKIWGQDASWLMNTTEQALEWADVTDGAAANSIFGNYGITPDPSNLDDDSPAHSSDGATLMQRASDAQFLRTLARRAGKLFRVFCTDTPGQRTGFFAAPDLSADPAITLTLNDAAAANVSALDISFDVMRPSAVNAFQALFTDQDADASGAGGNFSDDGLPTMSDQSLAAVTGSSVTALLTITAADSLAAQAPGVTRASAVWTWNDARQRTLVTIYVGDDSGAAASASSALTAAGDPNRPVLVKQATEITVALIINLLVTPGMNPTIISSNVVAALADTDVGQFGSSNLAIGQTVFNSQIEAAVLAVAGVVAITAQTVVANGATDPGLTFYANSVIDPGPLHTPGEDAFYTLDPAKLRMAATSLSTIQLTIGPDPNGG